MIKKPVSPLPFSLEEEVIGQEHIQHFVCSDKTYMGSLFTDRETPEYRPDEVHADAAYMVHAANEYPDIIEFLERLESVITDKKTSKIITDYLISKKIWEKDED